MHRLPHRTCHASRSLHTLRADPPRMSRRPTAGAFPGSATPGGFSLLSSARAGWIARDTLVMAIPEFGFAAAGRPMDPWAALHDFRAAPDLASAGRCVYRDYPRIALTRSG